MAGRNLMVSTETIGGSTVCIELIGNTKGGGVLSLCGGWHVNWFQPPVVAVALEVKHESKWFLSLLHVRRGGRHNAAVDDYEVLPRRTLV